MINKVINNAPVLFEMYIIRHGKANKYNTKLLITDIYFNVDSERDAFL